MFLLLSEPLANGAPLDHWLFISWIFMRLREPNLMFPGISNRTGRSLFRSNIVRNGAENVVLPFFISFED